MDEQSCVHLIAYVREPREQGDAKAGKNTKLVCVAIARELVGFVWDIVRQEMPRLKAAVS